MPPDTSFRRKVRCYVQNSQFLDYVHRAFRSGAYPIQGILYFAQHHEYWPLWAGRVLPLAIISLVAYLILFLFVYLPQVAFLAIWQGRGAWVNALVLTLGEGLVLIQALFEGFFVDEARVDVFDAILIDHGLVDLIASQRLLFPDAANSVKMLGKPTSRAEYSPWSLMQIFELVACLPLNFIPVVGAPAYVVITGARLGKLSHHRWFKLRGLSRREKRIETKKYSWEYVWFGTVAMILSLVPLLGLFFILTTTAGCGLWVSRLERKNRTQPIMDARDEEERAENQDTTRARLAHQEEVNDGTQVPAAEDETPPPYSDDPLQ